MKHVKALTYIISSILTVFGGIGLTMATTWINPTATPPNNGDIDVLSAGGYDGLGDHQARMDLNLTGHRLYGVNNHGTDRALTATSSNSTIAALITASNNFGTEVQSQANDQPAVLARNLGTGYALMASSTRGWAAQFGQALQLATSSIGIPARVQWGTGSTNYLSTASAGSAAAGSLYWGMMPLCDMGQADCGRVKASLGDNLGNHTAQFNLNMMQHSLINLQNKIGTVLATSSLQLTHVGIGASNFGPGLSAVSQNVNGIVAINTIAAPAVAASGYNSGTGYGVTGQSIFGPGISLYGRMKLLTEAASTTLPQLTFGKPVHNASLALTPISAADQNLYWGDKLLCDSSKSNCGWSAVAGTPSLWTLIGGNLFNDRITSIGGIGQQAKLEVLSPFDFNLSTQNISLGVAGGDGGGQYSFGSDMTDIEDGVLYVLTKEGINIYNLANPRVPSFVRSINLSPATFDTDTASIDVVGSYAYIAHGTSGFGSDTSLIIVDIQNSTIVTSFNLVNNSRTIRVIVKGQYAYIGGSKLSVVNITNPAVPVLVDESITTINTADMVIEGDYLYSLDGIVSLSNPALPLLMSKSNKCGGLATDTIAVRGNILFIGCSIFSPSSAKIQSWDASNPSSPTQLDSVDVTELLSGTHISSIYLVGRYAYITHATASGNTGNGTFHDLDIIDINNPANMALVVGKDFGNYGLYSLAIRGPYGYAYNDDASGNGNDDLFVFGPLSSAASFQNLNLGYALTDSVVVSSDMTNNGNIYLRSGLSVRGDVTLTVGTLNSGVGIINIGGVKLDRGLLQTLITWSNS